MLWTLRKKILIGYGITLAVAMVVFLWAFVNLLRLGHASDAILSENYRSILAAENMIDAIERQDSGTLLIISGYEDDGLKQFRTSESLFLQWLGRAKDNITIEGEDEIINSIDTGYSSYLVNFSSLKLFLRTEPKKAAVYYHEKVLPSFTAVRDACIHLRDLNEETMVKASDHARRVARKAIWSMVTIGSGAILLGLGFSLLLSNFLVRPLRQIMEATQDIAEGNYSVQVSAASADELGRLSVAFNTMVEKLRTYHDLNVGRMMAEKRRGDAIIQSIEDGIVVVDAEFKITGINRTAAKLFACETGNTLDRHFLEVIKNEELFNYIKESAQSGSSPKIEQGRNVLTVRQDGGESHYLFSITPVKTETGSMIGVVLLFRDITSLKELDRLKSEFVMTASHELRTPLTSLGMSVDLLREGVLEKLTDKEQQLLLAAHEDLQRLKALVNNLLDLSRIEAGKIEMDFDRVPVQLLFEKAVSSLIAQANDKEVQLTFTAPSGLPKVKADANKTTWVLTNLISNALRYTSSGGKIRLYAEHFGAQVHVSVSDDGAGIPYEYQTKIFEKFVQVKSDKATQGTGLGLAICKEIVRAHGGTIWVDSTPGEGSTFTFTLPVSE
ncbi:MAG: cell wall metabolism sensor histidine kinase WalK [Deltaproteobacteria bacterium]|nr:cell wall metabolism sensor histidine kinase WalK [Deltaproteobacteria bacterium]